MAEGARLESVYTATYRGFESPPHRHIQDKSSYESTGFFLLLFRKGGMRTPTGVRQLATASWTDCERSEQAARRASEASQSPPVQTEPPQLQKSPRISTGRFKPFLSYSTYLPAAFLREMKPAQD